MDNCDVRGNIDPAVLLGRCQTKHVVIFVDRAADRAQRVVAVGQDVGQREFLHSRCSRRLHDAYKGNIVGSHGVELDPKLVHIVILVMRFQNRVSDCALFGLLGTGALKLRYSCCFRLGDNFVSTDKVNTAVI